MSINDAALAGAIKKMRKLRLIDHVAIKDEAPPALTFLAIMQRGLGGMYDDAALEYIFRRFLKYYEAYPVPSPTSNSPERKQP